MSSATTYFVQSCPACGRSVQIKLWYLGKQVRCVHCNREFTATDTHGQSAANDDPVQYWLNYTTSVDVPFDQTQVKRPR